MPPTSWGHPCSKCGHPASYHGMSFCTVLAGAGNKRECDCDGYFVYDPKDGRATPVVWCEREQCWRVEEHQNVTDCPGPHSPAMVYT